MEAQLPAMNTPPIQWIPARESVTIQGRVIRKGMVYLKTNDLTDDENKITDYAIDTVLPVISQHEVPEFDSHARLNSYASMSETGRSAYLNWLSKGASDPEAPLSFVLLYLTGIEYRVVYEKDSSELNLIFQEILRLRATYGHHASFLEQTDQLIDIFLILKNVPDTYSFHPRHRPRRTPRISTKLALGQAAYANAPLSADWVLYWILEDAETRLRQTTHRLFHELKSLFRIRFQGTYPEGFTPPSVQQNLVFNYVSLNSIFEKQFTTIYPDLTLNPDLLDAIRPIFEACCAELEPYRLATETIEGGEAPLPVLALLPRELGADRIRESSNAFISWLQDLLQNEGHAVTTLDTLTQQWIEYRRNSDDASTTITIDESKELASVLDCLGIGIEPDGRHSYQRVPQNGQIVLFETKEPLPGTLSETYWRVLLLLRLVAAVAHADNAIANEEVNQLLDHIRDSQTLSGAEMTRLTARLYFMLKHPPSIDALKQELEERTDLDDRKKIANYALVMALADGRFVPSEVTLLKKIYGWLGLNPNELYTDLHELGADTEPIVVHLPQTKKEWYTIPEEPEQQPEQEPDKRKELDVDNIELDIEAINKKMQDTSIVNGILQDIFTDDEESFPEFNTDDMNTGLYAGLQEHHARILEQLLTQPSWPRDQYNTLVKQHGLMPEGIPEIINDWAIDQLGDILIEVDETVEIFYDTWEEYTHEQKEN